MRCGTAGRPHRTTAGRESGVVGISDPLNDEDLARLQQAALAGVLGARPLAPGVPAPRLADLQFARSGDALALSEQNLASGLDVAALPQRIQVGAPADLRDGRAGQAASGAGYLQFSPARVDGDQLTMGLQVLAFPPGSAQPVPISAVTLRYRRHGGDWLPSEPPAALSS